MDVSNLTIKIQTSGLETAQQGLDRLGQKAHKAETSAQQLANSFKSLNTVIAGVASSLVVREFIKTADEMSLLNSRLKMTTSSMGEFTRQQKEMHKIARDTHSSIQDVTNLYVKLAPALKGVGKSTQEINKITSSFTKALQLGGASAEESASAIKQFGQAMGSGVLRGEEFNAIAEASPTLLRYLAEGLNVPIGKLRELGSQGKLTAEALANAFDKMNDKISADFKNMPLTVGKATTDLQTEISLLISDFDKASGASSSMANSIASIADTIKDNKDDIIEFGRDVYRSFQLMGTGVLYVGTAVTNVFTAIPTAVLLSIDTMSILLENKLNYVIAEAEKAYNYIAQLWDGQTKFERVSFATNLSDGFVEFRQNLENEIKLITDTMGGLVDDIKEDTTSLEKYLMQGGVAEALKKMNESTKKTGTTSSKSAQEINSLNRALLEIAQVGMDEYEKKIFAVEQKTKEWIKAGVDSNKALAAQKILLDQAQTEHANDTLKAFAEEKQKAKDVAIKSINEELKLADRRFNLKKRQAELTKDEISKSMQLIALEYEHTQAQYEALLKKGEITKEYYDQAMRLEKKLYERQIFDASRWGQIMHSGLNSLETAMGSFFDYSSDRFMKFGDLANDILSSIAREMTKMMIIQPFVGVLSEGIGGLFGGGGKVHSRGAMTLQNAQGNVFSSKGLHEYVNSIVSKPTFFEFASGGVPSLGVMGEKNGGSPEAIIPLTRMSNGDLGVKSSGVNNVKIEVINQTREDAQVTNVSSRQNMGEQVISIVIDAVRTNKMGMRDILGGGR